MPSDIALLIRTSNSESPLRRLFSLLDWDENVEVVVVDSGSTDATLSVAEKVQSVIVKAPLPFHYSTSLNAGIASATAPWVVVMSPHVEPLSPDLLFRLKGRLDSLPEDVAAAYGGIFSRRDIAQSESPPELIDAKGFLQRQSLPGGNPFAAYRKSLLLDHAFDVDARTAEDLIWGIQALSRGSRLAYLPDCAVLYRNRGTLFWMWTKGLLEQSLTCELGLDSRSFWKILILDSLSQIKRMMTWETSLNDAARVVAHHLGAMTAKSGIYPVPTICTLDLREKLKHNLSNLNKPRKLPENGCH